MSVDGSKPAIDGMTVGAVISRLETRKGVSNLNYIHKLQGEKHEAEVKLAKYALALTALEYHVQSPKFTGVDSNGERKDWIATGDVLRWIQAVRNDVA